MARITSFFPFLHPSQINSGDQEYMARMVFSNLIHVDKDLTTFIPDLAAKWDPSPDATTYTFHLDPRAVWSDGQPVTATDVIYTITWAAQHVDAYVGEGIEAWLAVKGAASIKGTSNPLPGITSPDPLTVVITLETPDAIWLRQISESPYFIMPDHVLHDLTDAEASTCAFCIGTPGKTIGSGPYDLATPINAQGAEFTAKHGYWKGIDPNIQRIVFKVQDPSVSITQLQAGELDLLVNAPPDAAATLSQVPGLKTELVKGGGGFILSFNNTSISDKRVRQAIAYAINRPQIIQQVLAGAAENWYIIPPGLKKYSDIDPYDFNPDKSRQLLQAAKWDANKTFKIIYEKSLGYSDAVMPVIGQELEDVGIKVELDAVETAVFNDALASHPEKYDMYVGDGGSEGLGFWESQQYYSCQKGTNVDMIPAAECLYDALFKQARSTTVPDVQDGFLHKLALRFDDQVPAMYMWADVNLHVYTDRLGGGFAIYAHERESFDTIETWTLAP